MDIRSLWGLRYRAEFALQSLAGALASRPVSAPAERFLFHSGYRTQLDESSGGYSSGFQTPLAERFTPPAGALAKRVVFLVNPDTVPPPVAAALQAAGDGAIVSEGELSEDGLVHQKTIDLGEGFLARVRVSEILPQPGWAGLRADVQGARRFPGGRSGVRGGARAAPRVAETGGRRSGRSPALRGLAPGPALRRDDGAHARIPPAGGVQAVDDPARLLPLSPPDRRLGRRAAGVHRPHGAGAGRPRVRPDARRDGGPRQRRPRQPDGEPHPRRPLRQDPGAGGHPLDRERLGGDRGRRGREGVGRGDRGCRAHARRRAGRGAGRDAAALSRRLDRGRDAPQDRRPAALRPRRLAARADRARPRGSGSQRCG